MRGERAQKGGCERGSKFVEGCHRNFIGVLQILRLSMTCRAKEGVWKGARHNDVIMML
jgi:hypothetical protein